MEKAKKLNSYFEVELINDNKLFTFKGDYEAFIKTYAKNPLNFIILETVGVSRDKHKALLKKIKDLDIEQRELKKLEYLYKNYTFNSIQVISVKYLKSKEADFKNETIFDKFLFC